MYTYDVLCMNILTGFFLFDGKDYQVKLIVSFPLGVKHLHEKRLRWCASITMFLIKMLFSLGCYFVNVR